MAPPVPLDIYVMPLARYLAGEFEPPPAPEDDPRFERPRPDASPHEARGRVDAMWHHMGATLGREVAWRDEGEVALAECGEARLLHGLRALAAHHEYPPGWGPLRRAFRLAPDPRTSASLRKIYDGADTRFVHLMRHSDNRGFWFPLDYDTPQSCGEPDWWMVGSAVGLARELEQVAALLPAVGRDPDRAALETALEQWRRVAQTSAATGLPIIIEG